MGGRPGKIECGGSGCCSRTDGNWEVWRKGREGWSLSKGEITTDVDGVGIVEEGNWEGSDGVDWA